MTEDIKNVLSVDMEEKPTKNQPPPPQIIHLRWSSVLNKYVLGGETDRDAIPYRMTQKHAVK